MCPMARCDVQYNAPTRGGERASVNLSVRFLDWDDESLSEGSLVENGGTKSHHVRLDIQTRGFTYLFMILSDMYILICHLQIYCTATFIAISIGLCMIDVSFCALMAEAGGWTRNVLVVWPNLCSCPEAGRRQATPSSYRIQD